MLVNKKVAKKISANTYIIINTIDQTVQKIHKDKSKRDKKKEEERVSSQLPMVCFQEQHICWPQFFRDQRCHPCST